MATSPERKLQKWVLEELKKEKRRGRPLFFWKISDSVRSGLPDIKMILNGHSGAAELKSPGKKMTKLQSLTLGEMEEAGATIGCAIDSKESWLAFWSRYMAEAYRTW